ncbi:MAG: hypothetical protein HUJ26_09445 [Planctomycetaceae bacterium]|nr:hypothetical protein [Planctomycetaceae bacterium]
MHAQIRTKIFRGFLALLLLISGQSALLACPFCSAPSLTLSEQMAQADAVLQIAYQSAEKGAQGEAGKTTYKIVRIIKAPEGLLKEGGTLELPLYRAASKGDLFLLTGSQTAAIEWATPLDVSKDAFNYIVNAPAPDLAYSKRLPYFLKYLEHKDEVISNDAYGEFANAPYEEISKVADQVPTKKVREWVTNEKTVPTRLGLYGLLLGLAGNETDAQVMLAKINEPTQDFRLGIDGIMSGYLMIAKADGLKELEKSKLKGKDVPFSETYAAMQALRFMWKYQPGTIAKDDLRAAMRVLLERPELADLVIADLARWEDWEVIDRLIAMYGEEDFNIPSIKRAIIRYLLVSSSQESEVAGDPPAYVVKASSALEEIQEKDPKIYRDAKRFFRLR